MVLASTSSNRAVTIPSWFPSCAVCAGPDHWVCRGVKFPPASWVHAAWIRERLGRKKGSTTMCYTWRTTEQSSFFWFWTEVNPKFLFPRHSTQTLLLIALEETAECRLRRLFFYVISGLYVTECLNTSSLNKRSAQLIQMRYMRENVITFKLFF